MYRNSDNTTLTACMYRCIQSGAKLIACRVDMWAKGQRCAKAYPKFYKDLQQHLKIPSVVTVSRTGVSECTTQTRTCVIASIQ